LDVSAVATVIGVGFAVLSGVIAMLTRVVKDQQRQTDQIKAIAKKTQEIAQTVNHNQEQTDKRVRYLEENFWRRR
jgi:hypothetical protein